MNKFIKEQIENLLPEYQKTAASWVKYFEKKWVTVEDYNRLQMRCKECHTGWFIMLRLGGKIPRLSWLCPNNCNALDK